jgi:hypothetical protein
MNSRLLRRRGRRFCIEPLEPRLVLAAPVAVDDQFTIDEDHPLIVTPFEFSESFNSSSVLQTGATWNYLDRIENSLGAGQAYPTDGVGRAWNHPQFNVATSTASIGAWSSGPTPLQSGGINAFPGGTPDVLFGVDDADDGRNLVTTYLFRSTFVLDDAQAAASTGFADLLCDDGCVGFINGARAFSLNFPDTTYNSETFAPVGQTNEDTYTQVPLDLSGVNLVEGVNSVAVEVHQASFTSSDVGFDLSGLAFGSSQSGGFEYVDDPFGTSRPANASGSVETAGGFTGGALTVEVGGNTGQGQASSGAISICRPRVKLPSISATDWSWRPDSKRMNSAKRF